MTDETTGATPAEPTTAPAVEDGKPTTEQVVETTEAKPEGEAETTEATEPTEETDDNKPKRLPRSQRDKRKISYLAGENARLAQEISELRTLAERAPKADAEPKLEDFNFDVDKFNDAKSRWNIRQEISSLKTELQRDQLTERQQRLAQNRVRELQERADAIKDRVPDFDRVLKDFADDGGVFSEHVKEAVIKVGPELAYYLAKNPDIAEELNELDPIEAAIRIGELRPKLSLAQPRKQTQAPAPLKGLSGGAAPSKSLADLAKQDDLSAYIKARDAEDAAARRR
jgi:DNA repair exonuclease SbcCD ATPase subunit